MAEMGGSRTAVLSILLSCTVLAGACSSADSEPRASTPASCLRYIVAEQRRDKAQAAADIDRIVARLRYVVHYEDFSRSRVLATLDRHLDKLLSVKGRVAQERKCGSG